MLTATSLQLNGGTQYTLELKLTNSTGPHLLCVNIIQLHIYISLILELSSGMYADTDGQLISCTITLCSSFHISPHFLLLLLSTTAYVTSAEIGFDLVQCQPYSHIFYSHIHKSSTQRLYHIYVPLIPVYSLINNVSEHMNCHYNQMFSTYYNPTLIQRSSIHIIKCQQEEENSSQ